MEEIQRAHGGSLAADDAMHMLADALENGGQSNAVGSDQFRGAPAAAGGAGGPPGGGQRAELIGRRLSQQEIDATPVAAYAAGPPAAGASMSGVDDLGERVNTNQTVRFINRTRVQFNRSVIHHDSKVRFTLRAPGCTTPLYSADLSPHGNFVIFDAMGRMAARLDCLPNKTSFILREPSRIEGDAFAPGIAGIKFKTLTSNGYKFRYGLFVCAKNWRDPIVVPDNDWMKRFLEIESVHLDQQVSPAEAVLQGGAFNILVSSAKYHLTSLYTSVVQDPYIESVKQCIFVHPHSSSACVIGKIAEDRFDVLYNNHVSPLFAFAMAISTIRAKTA